MVRPEFLVRIWGARGSLSAPAALSRDSGSDTCCVEMRCGPHVLVFDAGSGAASLGTRMVEQDVRDFDLFFTHCHFDHIIGLPFMAPLYRKGFAARLYAGHFEDGTTCQEMVEGLMCPPYFPLTPEHFQAAIEFRDFQAPETLFPKPGVAVRTVRLNHPGGAIGYRVDFDGRSACYITDTEHAPGQPDQAVLGLMRGADMAIYDCMYTDAEFAHFRGYGHSTWEEGVRLCEAAGVARLVLFHHQITRDDDALRDIESAAQARFPGAILARTGLEVRPDNGDWTVS